MVPSELFIGYELFSAAAIQVLFFMQSVGCSFEFVFSLYVLLFCFFCRKDWGGYAEGEHATLLVSSVCEVVPCFFCTHFPSRKQVEEMMKIWALESNPDKCIKNVIQCRILMRLNSYKYGGKSFCCIFYIMNGKAHSFCCCCCTLGQAPWQLLAPTLL